MLYLLKKYYLFKLIFQYI